MISLDDKFLEMKSVHFSKAQIIKGYGAIGRILNPTIYLKLCWEFVTTFVVYAPSASNYMKDLIQSIRKKWIVLSEKEQENIVAALTHLNKRGKIENALSKY